MSTTNRLPAASLLMDQIFGGDEQRTATLRQYDAALAMIDIHLAHAKVVPALCFDCTTPLPADVRYDVCTSCLRAQVSAERARESCANSLPERGYCVCSQHGSVR